MVRVRRTAEIGHEHRDKVLDAMGRCRKALIDGSLKLDFNSPTLGAFEEVREAIDRAAAIITGCAEFYHAQGTSGQRGKPTWVDTRS